MENPTYTNLVAMLAASMTENDNRHHHVIKAMREKVVPAITRMSKQQLVEAFSEAVYAIHNMETDLHAVYGTAGIIQTIHDDRLGWKLTAGHLENELKAAPEKARKASSDNANDVLHKEDRDSTKKILEAWATGEFESLNDCARKRWQSCNFFTFNTARRNLNGAPDPDPWPANPKKKK